MSDLPEEFRLAYFWSNETSFPARFAIVTAYNPDGVNAEDSANRIADERLRVKLVTMNTAPFRVTGGARDRSHLEPGWGFADGTPGRALQLAREFKQLGIFWVNDRRVSLIDVATGKTQYEVPWAERFLGPAPRPMPDV